jgi:hypothetical protein
LSVRLTATRVKGGLNYLAIITGLVPQTVDAATGKAITDTGQQLQTATVKLDGQLVGGADPGDAGCRTGTPLVWADASLDSGLSPLPASPGTHVLTVTVTACGGLSMTKTVTVTVS